MIAHFEGVARQAGSAAIGIGVGMYAGYGPAQRLYQSAGFRGARTLSNYTRRG